MNGYWGHPAMRLSPDVNLLAFTHYVQALEYQRKALQVVGILGGKTPHIQNLTVGGVSNAIDLDSPSAIGMDRLEMIRVLLDEVVQFIHQVYFVDVCAVAAMYPDWFKIGSGVAQLPGSSRSATGQQGHILRPSRRIFYEWKLGRRALLHDCIGPGVS